MELRDSVLCVCVRDCVRVSRLRLDRDTVFAIFLEKNKTREDNKTILTNAKAKRKTFTDSCNVFSRRFHPFH